MILAVTTQQALGIAVAAVMVVGWAVYLAVTLRRRPHETPGAEVELAPNRRPYFDDETMEGPRLERSLAWALVLLGAVALGLPAYWLNEPSRQSGAIEMFDAASVNRGRQLFDHSDSKEHGDHFGCADCHGGLEGAGGAVSNYAITNFLGATEFVTWQAPALNTVLLRMNAEEVRRVLVYGRPNSPMPAWGVEGGGPMNDQQIDDLVNYIASITLTSDEAKKVTQEELAKAREDASAAGEVFDEGKALFELHCARCHTKGWSYGKPDVPGGGAFGPNLTNGATIRQFPDPLEHEEFIINGSDFEKPYGVRGVGSGRMPGFGDRDVEGEPVAGQLTLEQIRAIVAYERSL